MAPSLIIERTRSLRSLPGLIGASRMGDRRVCPSTVADTMPRPLERAWKMPKSKSKRSRYQPPPPKKRKPSPRWFGFHEVFHAFTVAAYLVQYIAVSIVVYSHL